MPSDDKRVVSFEELYARQLPLDVYEPPPVPPGTRLVRIKDQVVKFKRAPMKRASRAARPSEPSQMSRRVCMQLIQTRETELKRNGRTKLSPDDTIKYRSGSASGGRGPAVRAQVEQEQARMNHIATLKARNVETYNNEASFLLWGNTSEQCYDKLAESALRANAGNSSVTKRNATQGRRLPVRMPQSLCPLVLFSHSPLLTQDHPHQLQGHGPGRRRRSRVNAARSRWP